MKKLILAAGFLALVPSAASAQLLGGGGLGGSLGGTLGGNIGSTVDTTTRTVRSTVDSTARGSTEGEQSVDARRGRVEARRSASGSANASSASLADLPIPPVFTGSASGEGSASGNAGAQLIGTDAVTGAAAPLVGQARSIAEGAAARTTSAAQGAASRVPSPALPGLAGSGSAAGSAMGSIAATPLAVAGSAAGAAGGTASVAPGMPVMTPDGAPLGKVREVVADSRGRVQQLVVQQGNVVRTLPAGMFSASGNALIAGSAQGEGDTAPSPAEDADTAE
ncbi:hypothetical protein WAB17_09205 [Parerythrobacter aurantius]|uniref:hypothetical protein n=1 Tax=Parerythrobacter aurantius TaxID=3127706 RepID=UPI003246A0B4